MCQFVVMYANVVFVRTRLILRSFSFECINDDIWNVSLLPNLLGITSCAGSGAICPRPCTPHAAAQLQPIHALRLQRTACLAPWIFMIDRQWLALGGGVETGVIHINYVVTWTANQSSLVTLIFDLLTLKVVSWVTCDMGYLCANFSLPRPLCSQVRPDVRDRQTDIRQKHRLMPLPIRGGV